MTSTSRTADITLSPCQRAANTNGVTVGQLRTALLTVPDDTVLILSSDAEGNSHSPLARASVGLYEAETTWSGEAYVSDEQISKDGFTEEDQAPEGAIPVIFLDPTN